MREASPPSDRLPFREFAPGRDLDAAKAACSLGRERCKRPRILTRATEKAGRQAAPAGARPKLMLCAPGRGKQHGAYEAATPPRAPPGKLAAIGGRPRARQAIAPLRGPCR